VQKVTREEARAASSEERMEALRLEMFAAAENLEFEKAARIGEELKTLERAAGGDGKAGPSPKSAGRGPVKAAASGARASRMGGKGRWKRR